MLRPLTTLVFNGNEFFLDFFGAENDYASVGLKYSQKQEIFLKYSTSLTRLASEFL